MSGRILFLHRQRLFLAPVSVPVAGGRRGLRGHVRSGRHPHGAGPGRPTYHASRILLEKFIKVSKYDCSLLAKCPYHLKVRGSFFDANRNVDRSKNRQVLNILRSQGVGYPPPPPPSPPLTSDEFSATSKSEDRNPLFHAHQDTPPPELGGDVVSRNVAANLSWEFQDELDSDKREMYKNQQKSAAVALQSDGASTSDANQDQSEVEDLEDGQVIEEVEGYVDSEAEVPLHVLFYGRSSYRLDSYSIMNCHNQQQSHVYLTDASSVDEAVAMFSADPFRRGQSRLVDPVGAFSIWQSKRPLQTTKDGLGDHLHDELTSGFKIYVPPHISYDSLKTVFLVPTVMNKIFLEGERQADVELDGSLINDLDVVGLSAEAGNVRVIDISANDIRLGSKLGSVTCDGAIECGNVMAAEVLGNGDFTARHLEGGCLTVTTECGNIHVWGECRCSRSHFFTKSGNVILPEMYNQNFVSIKERGSFMGKVVDGSVSSVMKRGHVDIQIENLTHHSTIHLTEGDVIITVPKNPSFKITVSAPSTDVAPSLINTGDFYLTEERGYETFSTMGLPVPTAGDGKEEGSDEAKKHIISFHETEPTLNVITNCGKIVVKVSDQIFKKKTVTEEEEFST